MDDRQPRSNLSTTTIFFCHLQEPLVSKHSSLESYILLSAGCANMWRPRLSVAWLTAHIASDPPTNMCLFFTEHSTSELWVVISALPFLPSTRIPLFTMYPRVLMAAESRSCALGQRKNKPLEVLFLCSGYFYKWNPHSLSPHTQLFLSFLTRFTRKTFGDCKWRQEGGTFSWLCVGWIFWECWHLVWPENTSGGEWRWS